MPEWIWICAAKTEIVNGFEEIIIQYFLSKNLEFHLNSLAVIKLQNVVMQCLYSLPLSQWSLK